MKKYIKTFLDYYGYAPGEYIPCFICSRNSNDLHHVIFRSQGGTDEVTNICPLCRDCHTKAHTNKEFNEKLKNKFCKSIK